MNPRNSRLEQLNWSPLLLKLVNRQLSFEFGALVLIFRHSRAVRVGGLARRRLPSPPLPKSEGPYYVLLQHTGHG